MSILNVFTMVYDLPSVFFLTELWDIFDLNGPSDCNDPARSLIVTKNNSILNVFKYFKP